MNGLENIGAQSYSFRTFPFEGAISQLKALGADIMEFCAVHFPANAQDPGFPKVLDTIRAAGISVPCYGVEAFTADANVNRKKFEFARALGANVLTADPEPDSFANLETLVEEFGIAIAIHNHGPGARYDKVADTLNAVKGRHPLIGACVDTGHYLRSGEHPHEAIRALGSRVISLHLKDWRIGGNETILGEGDMDLAAVARELKAIRFAGPIVMEYEESPDNPVPDMKQGLAAWRAAVASAGKNA